MLARRGENPTRMLPYDERFIYVGNGYKSNLDISKDRNNTLHAKSELLEMFASVKDRVVIPESEKLLFERAHPLLKVADFVEGDADLLVFRRIFGIPNDTIIIRTSESLLARILTELRQETPPANLIILVGNMTSQIDADTVYLLSLHYQRVTLLQPAISKFRYLVCLTYKGRAEFLPADLEVIEKENRGLPLTRIFAHLPQAFIGWLYKINNVHIGINTELEIHILYAKQAFDKGKAYWTGASYDRRRLLSTLYGGPTIQQVIESEVIERQMDVADDLMRTDIHIWGSSDLRLEEPLHKILNFERDRREPYNSRRGEVKGGDHHGQRKLLLAEMEFLTERLEPNEQAIIIYIGAAPGSHTPLLFDWFSNIRMWLVDPRRNVWDEALNIYGEEGRLMITSDYYNEEFAGRLANIANSDLPFDEAFPELVRNTRFSNNYSRFRNGVTKFFFWSDIRRADPTSVSNMQHEVQIDADMRLQVEGLSVLENAVGSDNFLAMLKFRLPFVGDDEYRYMSGELYTQVWPRLTTTELRLVGKPSFGETVYSKRAVEEIMFYHNKVLRNTSYGPTEVEGYGSCHDCHREVDILTRYVTTYLASRLGEIDVDTEVEEISIAINNFLGTDLESHALKTFNRTANFSRMLDSNRNERLDPYNEYHREHAFNDIEREFISHMPSVITGAGANNQTFALIHKQFVVYSIWVRSDVRSITLRDEADIADVQFTSRIDDILNAAAALALIIRDNIQTSVKIDQNALQNKVLTPWFKFIEQRLMRLRSILRREHTNNGVSFRANRKTHMFSLTTSIGNGPVKTTDEYHEDVIQRFLIGAERSFGYKNIQLLHQNEVTSRAYSALLRYKSIWMRTMSQAPVSLYNSNPQLPGVECGATLVSAFDRNEEFCASQTDFELLYTSNVSPFSSGFFPDYFQAPVVTVFPPNITPLLFAFIDKWVSILESKVNDALAIVFIYPDGPATLALRNKEMFAEERDLEGDVFDYRLGHNVKLGTTRKVIVLKTQSSTFSLIP